MAALDLDFRNTNSLWCSVLVETLQRLGLTHAVVSPGSRSTALTTALVGCPSVETIPVLDERSAAFFALGLAKRQRRPVVLVCTSGTAGANYLPALIEAHESGIPLLVLTADRPPEMRECSSGQTIDQQKLFGSHVSWYHELAVPEARLDRLRYLRQMVMHAWERAIAPTPGPVHLNCPFRDPLAPLSDTTAEPLKASLDESFFDHLAPISLRTSVTTIWQRVTTARGLIVAGPATPEDPAAYAEKVLSLATDLDWPVLADILSPLRTHARNEPSIVTTYDAILRDERAAKQLTPRYILCLGGWPTSKVLRGWIEGSQAEVLLVSAGATNRDALHGRTRQINAGVESLAVSGNASPDTSYRDSWSRAEKIARATLDDALAADSAAKFEGVVSWTLARVLPQGTSIFVASSMPIRDVEYVWPANGGGQRLFFNRGANGIDGTLSTAIGVAHGGSPAVLLTGDLALLHDSNGFLLHSKFKGSLTIILINNRGGGIFEHLPIAQFEPPFEEYFATPQTVDFALLASAHAIRHHLVSDWADLNAQLSEKPIQGIRVLEVRTDRKRDAAFRRKLFASVASEVSRQVFG